MAAEKPVVSTPVPGVVQLYGAQVVIARTGEDFIAACEALLAEPARARQQRAEAMLNTVFSRPWNHTVAEIHRMLQAAWTVDVEIDTAVALTRATSTNNAEPLHEARPAVR